MGFRQLQHSHLPGIDHRPVIAFHLEGVSNDGEGLHEIVLIFAESQAVEEVRLLEDLFLVL